jgi:hypothetical protein
VTKKPPAHWWGVLFMIDNKSAAQSQKSMQVEEFGNSHFETILRCFSDLETR